MSILIFIVVIVALIVVHEFGHFVAAKLSGMRVDEFGLGYPPRALVIGKIGETEYTLNWLPFGGFVKIHGENGLLDDVVDTRSFTAKSRPLQAIVLVAGIAMNLLFAYVLITGALVAGTPRALGEGELANARDVKLAVANILPGSPAARAGLAAGDFIISAQGSTGQWSPSTSLGTGATAPKSFSSFIAANGKEAVTLDIQRNGGKQIISTTPKQGIATSDPSRYALGIEIVTVGTVPISPGAALVEGASLTWGATKLTALGLWHFFYGIVTFSADFSQVAGPVGIAGVVGSAATQGLGDLLSLVAIISINLALINLIPIPALDGGRLLFVIVEGIIRRPINPRIVQSVNAVGFAFLLLLMFVVTAHDILKIVG